MRFKSITKRILKSFFCCKKVANQDRSVDWLIERSLCYNYQIRRMNWHYTIQPKITKTVRFFDIIKCIDSWKNNKINLLFQWNEWHIFCLCFIDCGSIIQVGRYILSRVYFRFWKNATTIEQYKFQIKQNKSTFIAFYTVEVVFRTTIAHIVSIVVPNFVTFGLIPVVSKEFLEFLQNIILQIQFISSVIHKSQNDTMFTETTLCMVFPFFNWFTENFTYIIFYQSRSYAFRCWILVKI